MLPEIEVLKNHAKAAADTLDLAAVGGILTARAIAHHLHILTIDANDAAGRILKEIDATQECGFTGTAAANQRNHVAVSGSHGNTLQDFKRPKALVQIKHLNGFSPLGCLRLERVR